MRPLCYVVWLDNNLVKTLSNYHSPEILVAGLGVMRIKQDKNCRWEIHKTEVPCPLQIKETSSIREMGWKQIMIWGGGEDDYTISRTS